MAKTLLEGFDTFLGWLAPSTTEHNKAASHRGSVESCMANNFGCYNFFETGSFGNGTGIRHFSDTDYFAVCKSASLYNDSAYTLRKVKEALQETFSSTDDIEVHTPAVRIPFGTYASETLELTPCTFNGTIATPVGSHASYDIPDNDGGWMKSSPKAHNAYVSREDIRLNGKVKPLIKLIKAWKYYNVVPIRSFYLELRVAKYAEGETSVIYDWDVRKFIKWLYENDLPSIRDPMGISGEVRACSSDSKRLTSLSKLATAYSRAEKAFSCRESDLDCCFNWWDMFYNGKFPAR